MKNTLLKSLIHDNRFTYKDIAQITGFSRPCIWMIANGERKAGYDTAIILSSIFDLKPDEVFYDERVINLQDKIENVKKRKAEFSKKCLLMCKVMI